MAFLYTLFTSQRCYRRIAIQMNSVDHNKPSRDLSMSKIAGVIPNQFIFKLRYRTVLALPQFLAHIEL